MMCVGGVMYVEPPEPDRSRVNGTSPIDVRQPSPAVVAGKTAFAAGCVVTGCDAAIDVGRFDSGDVTRRTIDPMLTCTYPIPSCAAGHETLTQLPSSRVTSSTVPRGAAPMIGLPVLADL